MTRGFRYQGLECSGVKCERIPHQYQGRMDILRELIEGLGTRGFPRPEPTVDPDPSARRMRHDQARPVTALRPLVTVIDDDQSVREALPDLLRELGVAARAYESAEAFLASDDLGQAACLLLDVAMPGMTGPQLLRELRRRGSDIPIVFITGHTDAPATTRPHLLEQGAVECLFKPFTEADLLAALRLAILPYPIRS